MLSMFWKHIAEKGGCFIPEDKPLPIRLTDEQVAMDDESIELAKKLISNGIDRGDDVVVEITRRGYTTSIVLCHKGAAAP